jgi:hypothetical protein
LLPSVAPALEKESGVNNASPLEAITGASPRVTEKPIKPAKAAMPPLGADIELVQSQSVCLDTV